MAAALYLGWYAAAAGYLTAMLAFSTCDIIASRLRPMLNNEYDRGYRDGVIAALRKVRDAGMIPPDEKLVMTIADADGVDEVEVEGRAAAGSDQ